MTKGGRKTPPGPPRRPAPGALRGVGPKAKVPSAKAGQGPQTPVAVRSAAGAPPVVAGTAAASVPPVALPPVPSVSEARRAAALAPADSRALHQLGRALVQAGALAEGFERQRQALAAEPGAPHLWTAFAAAALDAGHVNTALAAAREAVARAPDAAAGHYVASLALDRLGRFGEALEAIERCESLAPGHGLSQMQTGAMLCSLGRPREALARIDAWRASGTLGDPNNQEWLVLESRAAFMVPDWPRAWRGYEARWVKAPGTWREPGPPLWQGEPLQSKRVLIWIEQGAGDAIQFVRFLPRLKALGAHVTLEGAPDQIAWLRHAPGVDAVLAGPTPAGAERPGFDFHLPLLSVPHVLGLGGADLGVAGAYLPLAPDARLPRALAGPAGARLRVGLAWSGEALHPNDLRRSARLESFLELCGLPGVEFHAIQRVEGLAADAFAKTAGALITNLTPQLRDWRDTARAIAALDLVVSVDTGPAHAAGALGVPALVLLSQDCDWRWGPAGDRTLWYPKHRLIRQTALNDWSGPVKDARTIVKQLAEDRAAKAVRNLQS